MAKRKTNIYISEATDDNLDYIKSITGLEQTAAIEASIAVFRAFLQHGPAKAQRAIQPIVAADAEKAPRG